MSSSHSEPDPLAEIPHSKSISIPIPTDLTSTQHRSRKYAGRPLPHPPAKETALMSSSAPTLAPAFPRESAFTHKGKGLPSPPNTNREPRQGIHRITSKDEDEEEVKDEIEDGEEGNVHMKWKTEVNTLKFRIADLEVQLSRKNEQIKRLEEANAKLEQDLEAKSDEALQLLTTVSTLHKYIEALRTQMRNAGVEPPRDNIIIEKKSRKGKKWNLL